MIWNNMMTGADHKRGLNVADVFSTDLYSGSVADRTITNGIDLANEGGLVWIKQRTGTNHHSLFDTVRGAGKRLITNLTNAEEPANVNFLQSFNADGFDLGAGAAVNGTGDFVAWTLRRAAGFFDVVPYVGDSVAGRIVSHTLGAVPGMIVVKCTSNVGPWYVYHVGVNETPQDYRLELHANDAAIDTATAWNDTSPTIDAFTLSNHPNVNFNGYNYVAYLFANNDLIKCGSYTGNGSSVGPVVTLDFEPQFLMVKRTDNIGDWWVYDNQRSPTNARTDKLLWNSSAVEDTAGEDVNFLSYGFQPARNTAATNGTGGKYIYMAIKAEDA